MHLEYQQGSKDSATDGAEFFAEEEEEAFIVDVKSGQFVAGVTLRNATSVRPVTTTSFSTTFAGEIESTRYGLGWVSSFGLALSLAIETKKSPSLRVSTPTPSTQPCFPPPTGFDDPGRRANIHPLDFVFLLVWLVTPD